MLEPRHAPGDAGPNGRTAGIVLIAAAVFTVVALAHHPTLHGTQRPTMLVAKLAALGAMDRLVHGVLLVLIGALLFGMTVFAARRGLRRESVLAAAIAYALGASSMIGAALIDGFVLSALASRSAGASAPEAAALVPVFAMLGAAVQVLARFATVATAAAVLLWSLPLIRARGGVRWAGVLGIASATGAVGMLAATHRLDPHSMRAVVLLQTVWYVAVGVLLLRGDL
jgi:hypothetical protein